jgi:hypothetical protein
VARHDWKGVRWTPSYFAASAGGAPLAALKTYVEQQRASSPGMNAGVSGAADLDETGKSKRKIAAGCLPITQFSPFATI